MTLEQVVSEIEARFDDVEQHDQPLWVGGRYFFFSEIVSGGIKEEGGESPVWCRNEETAIRLWRDAVLDYLNDKGDGKLAWRQRPSVDWTEFSNIYEPVKMCRVYSRMAIR